MGVQAIIFALAPFIAAGLLMVNFGILEKVFESCIVPTFFWGEPGTRGSKELNMTPWPFLRRTTIIIAPITSKTKGLGPSRGEGCAEPQGAYPRSSSAPLRAERVIPLAPIALPLATPRSRRRAEVHAQVLRW